MNRNSKNSRLRQAVERGHTNVRLVIMIVLLLVLIGLAAVSAYADNESTLPDGVQVFDVAGQTYILWPDGTHEQVCDCPSLVTDVVCYPPDITNIPTSTEINPNTTPEFTGTPESTATPMTSNTPIPTATTQLQFYHCEQGEGEGAIDRKNCTPVRYNNGHAKHEWDYWGDSSLGWHH